MGNDEAGTVARLRALRRELIDPEIAKHKGRIVKTNGDGLLVEFGSVVDAARCAVQVQQEMAARNTSVPPEQRIEFRIGINVGDIIIDGDDIFGDGVNIAARLEGMAEPGGICVSARVQEDATGKLDIIFEDKGEQSLKNIARPIRVYRVLTLGSGLLAARTALVESKERALLPLPEKPSIAVLPFQNMSGDPAQEYFVDGMVEEIITALSRIRWLFVIARNSSFTYKGKPVDVKQVGRELGVRYVLEGSVRKGGERLRITAQLIEAETGIHLWADHFDGSIEDVFDFQDKVAASVAGVIEPALQAAEAARSVNRQTTDLTAYDLYLRAYSTAISSASRFPEALALTTQAIARDPNYAPALGYAAICHFRAVTDSWSKDPEADTNKAIDYAKRALLFAKDDPGAIAHAAVVLGYFGEDIDSMIALVDRALTLNPSFARGWYISGGLRIWAGELEAGVESIGAALRLSPHARVGYATGMIGFAYLIGGRFAEALPKLRLAIQEDAVPLVHRALAVCYAHMGRLNEARETISRLRSLNPAAAVMHPYDYLRRPEHREVMVSGLRLALGETGSV
ncbi:MAG: adenylate/guanylate cyclase domain-containing protein [Alphaproteobacteria bacterium]|nr:adenylate/guanylate cyclase domain-containing protein [Alphaproteobacteria bacterium]